METSHEEFEEEEDVDLCGSSELSLCHDVSIKRNSKKNNANEEGSEEVDYQKNEKEYLHPRLDEKFKFVAKSLDKRFGKSDIEIGYGMHKRVFHGFDFNNGREVAWNSIKILNSDEGELDRIRQEIKIMKRVNHPNIINYISGWYDKQKQEVVIITEIICGGSLKKHLNKIIAPRLKVIKFWIKEILKGLNYLHNELQPAIIHRDIKCDNIFIDSTSGSIKIGDLGLAKVTQNQCTVSFVGTEEFMSPEVYQGKYTVLADIYSLGMCVLEMVTGEKPFKEYESNILKIYENSKKGVLPKCLERIINKDLKHFIISCLKPENERPSAIQLLNSRFINEIEKEENFHPVEVLPENDMPILSFNIEDTCSQIKNFQISPKNILLSPSTLSRPSYINTTNNSNNSNKYASNLKEKFNYNLNFLSEKSIKNPFNSVKKVGSYTNLIQLDNLNLISPDQKKDDNFLFSNDERKNIIFSKDLNSANSKFRNEENVENFNSEKIIYSPIKAPIKKSETPDNKVHKVSLKNSLNKVKTYFKKFEITFEEKIKLAISKEIHITFVIHKTEWLNGKKIKLIYDFKNEKIEDVIREVQKALNLTELQYEIILSKLSEFSKNLYNYR